MYFVSEYLPSLSFSLSLYLVSLSLSLSLLGSFLQFKMNANDTSDVLPQAAEHDALRSFNVIM
jgi:hypothetical protein